MCISVSENGKVKSIGGDEHISSSAVFPSLFPFSLPSLPFPSLSSPSPSLSPLPPSSPTPSHRSRQSLAWGPESTHGESQSPLVVRDHSVHVYCCLLLFIWCLSLLFVWCLLLLCLLLCLLFMMFIVVYLLLFVGIRYFV